MTELKRIIVFTSITLLIVGASLVTAQQVTVSRGQTFTVHVSIYKPENFSFPTDGAWLYGGVCNPDDYTETYNVGGWSGNVTYLKWENEERQENLSLQLTISNDAPLGTASLRVLLDFRSDNPIYENTGVVFALEAVEVGGERIPKYVPSRLVLYGHYYYIAMTDVSIVTTEMLPLWAMVTAIILVVLIIAAAVVKRRKRGVGVSPLSPETEADKPVPYHDEFFIEVDVYAISRRMFL
jgi:hypothetical protein